MRENLKNKEIKNFFIDFTYKIIRKKFKHYKLITISGVNNVNKNTYTKHNYLETILYINILLLFFLI